MRGALYPRKWVMCIQVVHLMNLVKLYCLIAHTDGKFNHRNELADMMYNTGKSCGVRLHRQLRNGWICHSSVPSWQLCITFWCLFVLSLFLFCFVYLFLKIKSTLNQWFLCKCIIFTSETVKFFIIYWAKGISCTDYEIVGITSKWQCWRQ